MFQEGSFPALGGLDLVSPPNQTPAGRLLACVNYESAERGYRRSAGYERLDGRPKPHLATYYILDFDAGTAAISAGDTVTGATSSAEGEALVDAVVESGTYGGSDAAGYLVLWIKSGTFQNDENLQVSAATKSVADGTASLSAADTDALDETYKQAAIEARRTDITTVPGSGNVRAVWVYDGVHYAVRDNAGATAGVLHKSSSTGWTAVDLGLTLSFTSGGTTEIAEGDTITGATSAATATVERVIITSGTFAGGDAAGRLILSGQTGTFQAENLDVGASADLATIAGDSSALALPVGGRYEFVNHNFGGGTGSLRMYGANGVGTAFEFDGSVFVPIITGMATDTPKHIAAHKNHLFLSFPGGSAQHSGIGAPYTWTIVSGAGEIAIGQEITGFLADTQGLLSIFGRNKIALLYGNDSTDWNLDTLTEDAGALEYTLQKIGLGLYVDDYGIRSLNPTDKFGDFAIGSLSSLVTPLFETYRKNGVTAAGSLRVRAKGQYRVFWSNGIVLTVDFRKKDPEATLQNLDMAITCSCSSEDSSGNEILLFGAADGYIYELDKGTSHDGATMEHFLRFAFWDARSPQMNKRWRMAVVEADPGAQSTLQVSAMYDYGVDGNPGQGEIEFILQGAGGIWDVSFWDDFVWSGSFAQRCRAPLDGAGPNIAVGIYGSAIYEEPHTIHSVTLHYRQLRQLRGA